MKFRHALFALLVASIGGCGGGVGEGGTGSFTLGRINGFGSVIVNGVRFEDSGATIRDDDDAVRRREELRLGMVVAIESTPIDPASATATALSIRVTSEVDGPIDAIDVPDGSLIVFGQTIRITDDTLFDDRLGGGIGALRTGQRVEVYGFLDVARGGFTATRIEPGSSTSTEYELRAPIDAIDPAARTIRIGGQTMSTEGLALPAGLAPGAIARVRARLVDGVLVVTRIDDSRAQVGDHEDARVEGRVTSLVTSRNFSIDALTVDASAAAFPDGEAGVVLGARIEVEGSLVDGTLVARKVELEDASQEFELVGTISGLDTSARTFVVRGALVHYPETVRFDDGTQSDLVNDRRVEVRGVASGNGTHVLATRIDFD